MIEIYNGQKIIISIREPVDGNYIEAIISDYTLVVEAKDMHTLDSKVRKEINKFYPSTDPKDFNIHYDFEFDEKYILTTRALCFDGYRYMERVWGEDRRIFLDYELDEKIPPSPLDRMAIFMMMQRWLMKWGGERKPFHGRYWRLFRTMFFHVVELEVAPEYRYQEYYDSWVLDIEPFLDRAIETIRRILNETIYDDNAPPRESCV